MTFTSLDRSRCPQGVSMLRTGLIVVGLLAGPLLMAVEEAKSPAKGWKEYRPQDRSFSVWLPDQGGRKSERMRTVLVRGTRFKFTVVNLQLNNGPTYSAFTVSISLILAHKISATEKIEI